MESTEDEGGDRKAEFISWREGIRGSFAEDATVSSRGASNLKEQASFLRGGVFRAFGDVQWNRETYSLVLILAVLLYPGANQRIGRKPSSAAQPIRVDSSFTVLLGERDVTHA